MLLSYEYSPYVYIYIYIYILKKKDMTRKCHRPVREYTVCGTIKYPRDVNHRFPLLLLHTYSVRTYMIGDRLQGYISTRGYSCPRLYSSDLSFAVDISLGFDHGV